MEQLNKIRIDFQENFKQALKESSNNKFILSGTVGLGKTEVLRNLNNYITDPVVICFPTHDLKSEFFKSKKKIVNCILTPKPPSNFAKFLSDVSAETSDGQIISHKVKNKFPDYYKKMNDIISLPDATLLTTHDAFLLSASRFKPNTIIFDEVPNLMFGNIINDSLFGLEELRYHITANRPVHYKELEKCLMVMQEQIRLNNPFLNDDQSGSILFKIKNVIPEELRKVLIKMKDEYKFHRLFKNISNILQFDFIYINYLSNKISSFNKFQFDDEKKYICLSATPDKELFNHYKFESLTTLELPLKTKIINIPISTSKLSLNNKENQKKINSLIKELKIDYVITYKDLELKNQLFDVYFGNAEGTNKYEHHEGSFGIIGTPMNNIQYFFDQAILYDKVKLTKEDFMMVNKDITINEHLIKFKTFQNNWLTNLHINQIYNELVQVIGRLRPYTSSNKKIYLFSKLPVLCK